MYIENRRGCKDPFCLLQKTQLYILASLYVLTFPIPLYSLYFYILYPYTTLSSYAPLFILFLE
jgi:hypothetical protein